NWHSLHAPVEREIRIKEIETDTFRYHLLRIIPIAEENKGCNWVGTLTDINDQKLVESKKDEFLSIASHELKTPLTGIKAYIQLVDRGVTTSDMPRAPLSMERAKDEVLILESLIADLLDISNIQNGQLKVNNNEIAFEKINSHPIDTIHHSYPSSLAI